MTSTDLFNRLTPALKRACEIAGCGYWAVPDEEHFFCSSEQAREFCELVLTRKPDDYNTFMLGIVVVVEFRGCHRLALTTIGQCDRLAEEQVATLLAAYDQNSPYSLRKLWEGRCGTFPM